MKLSSGTKQFVCFFWGVPCSKVRLFTIYANDGHPLSARRVHAPEPAFIQSVPHFIAAILSVCPNSEIMFSIIQSVVIYVIHVYLCALRDPKNISMHKNQGVIPSSPLEVPYRVKPKWFPVAFYFKRTPLVRGKTFKIFFVNKCNLTFCERNLAV
jgi:hypothetical protein